MRLISTEYPYIPQAPHGPDESAVLAVLVQDSQGKYRAYIGVVRRPDDRLTHDQRMDDAHWVAAHGPKLTYRQAIPEYFVGVPEGEYAQ